MAEEHVLDDAAEQRGLHDDREGQREAQRNAGEREGACRRGCAKESLVDGRHASDKVAKGRRRRARAGRVAGRSVADARDRQREQLAQTLDVGRERLHDGLCGDGVVSVVPATPTS